MVSWTNMAVTQRWWCPLAFLANMAVTQRWWCPMAFLANMAVTHRHLIILAFMRILLQMQGDTGATTQGVTTRVRHRREGGVCAGLPHLTNRQHSSLSRSLRRCPARPSHSRSGSTSHPRPQRRSVCDELMIMSIKQFTSAWNSYFSRVSATFARSASEKPSTIFSAALASAAATSSAPNHRSS